MGKLRVKACMYEGQGKEVKPMHGREVSLDLMMMEQQPAQRQDFMADHC